MKFLQQSAFYKKMLSGILLIGGVLGSVYAADHAHKEQSISNENVVNVYSARHYDSDQAIFDAFTKKTGIKVNLLEAKADALIERLKSEGASSPADVLITVDAGRLWRAQQQGIFQSVQSDILAAQVPVNLRHPDGLWVGLSKRARVVLYAKDRVDPSLIKSYADLAKPEWKGKVLVRPSSNIYNQSLVAYMIEKLGKEKAQAWLKGLVANFARKPEANDTAQIKALLAGVGDVAIVNHYYFIRRLKQNTGEWKDLGKKVGAIYFDGSDEDKLATHVNICGAGVTKHAPHKDNAIKLLEFLTSSDVQSAFAKGNNEYPIAKSQTGDRMIDDLGVLPLQHPNVFVYGVNQEEAFTSMQQAGW
jgi:iron(III) transport system substrate-binding protein